MAKKTTKQQQVRLSQALVLNKYMLSLFGCTSLEGLAVNLKDAALERYDENNVSLFYHEIMNRMYGSPNFTAEQLLQYDQNIYTATQQISEKRSENIKWKYYQYLSLLFTEIYLDRYFSDKFLLLADLNNYLENEFQKDALNYIGIETFTDRDLNKIAFWNATGSGKTLLMHVNILQYQYYVEQKNKGHVSRIILLTPNEGLSMQHLDELQLSNIQVELFSKAAGSLFGGKNIEIIDINKLGLKDGDKTVAVGNFEGANLVLVDEGHRGSTGETWKGYRDALCESGFSFEYSATFGQMVGTASGTKKKDLINEYGKATLFDYSYRYFYNDGYGKDYRILNIQETWNKETVEMYLTACLLSFYEQMLIFESDPTIKNQYLIEKPLAIFVGGSVTAVRTEKKQKVSDVVAILQFFESFIKNTTDSKLNISRLLKSEDGLIDKKGNSIFGSSFKFVRKTHTEIDQVYAAILSKLFNSQVAGAFLHLDNLKGQTGEIGLRVGNAEYFGVINVGDDNELIKICAEVGLHTDDKAFAEKSLFRAINEKDSKINMLIGSKKFTEGWSSWRVSTMGLLNVGQGEGSQIIQLFGRGVRLKGYKYCLKRSNSLDLSIKDRKAPDYLSVLETLNIFGIRADYMEQFKKYLEEEGLPTNDSDFEEVVIPMLPTVELSEKKLKYIRVKEGKDFKKEVTVTLDDSYGFYKIRLDWYPKIQMLRSGKTSNTAKEIQNETTLSDINLSFINWDKVYFDIQRLKNERSWYNFSLGFDKLKSIAFRKDWYTLLIPKADLEPTNFIRNISTWQEIVTSLLRIYVDKVYNNKKAEWMTKNMEVAYLDKSNPNFEQEYNILVHRDLDIVLSNLTALKTTLQRNEFVKDLAIDSNYFNAIFFESHLYQPLLYIDKNRYVDSETGAATIEISPVALNEGEKHFVKDLREYCTKNPEFFNDKELYLLRNQSRKGIGFFEANNFYPDFILWIKTADKQYVTFVDPKGVRLIDGGLNSPKIQLHRIIRDEIEPRLNDPEMILNSFIVSNSPYQAISHWSGAETLNQCNEEHLFFQNEQSEVYIGRMINKIIK